MGPLFRIPEGTYRQAGCCWPSLLRYGQLLLIVQALLFSGILVRRIIGFQTRLPLHPRHPRLQQAITRQKLGLSFSQASLRP